jgi:hypothetical protein
MEKDLESTSSDLVGLCDDLEVHVPKETRETEAWEKLDTQLRKIIHGLRGLAEQAQGKEHDESDGELELQLHLGLMDAHARWEAIQPSLARIKTQVVDAGEKMGQAIRDSLGDLEEQVRHLDESEAQRAEESRRDWEKTRESARQLAKTTLEEIRKGVRSVLPKGA